MRDFTTRALPIGVGQLLFVVGASLIDAPFGASIGKVDSSAM